MVLILEWSDQPVAARAKEMKTVRVPFVFCGWEPSTARGHLPSGTADAGETGPGRGGGRGAPRKRAYISTCRWWPGVEAGNGRT